MSNLTHNRSRGEGRDVARVLAHLEANEARLAPLGAPTVAHLPILAASLLVSPIADQLDAVIRLAIIAARHHAALVMLPSGGVDADRQRAGRADIPLHARLIPETYDPEALEATERHFGFGPIECALVVPGDVRVVGLEFHATQLLDHSVCDCGRTALAAVALDLEEAAIDELLRREDESSVPLEHEVGLNLLRRRELRAGEIERVRPLHAEGARPNGSSHRPTRAAMPLVLDRCRRRGRPVPCGGHRYCGGGLRLDLESGALVVGRAEEPIAKLARRPIAEFVRAKPRAADSLAGLVRRRIAHVGEERCEAKALLALVGVGASVRGLPHGPLIC
eukprot:2206175-Prymnesium_polylepis.1